MPKFKTQDEFINDVYAKYGDQFSVIGKYVRSTTRVRIKCNVCGYTFDAMPNTLLARGRGYKCKKCLMSNPNYANEVYKEYNGKFSVLSSYKGCDTPVLYRCNVHNKEFKMKPTSFRRSNFKCPVCKYNHATEKQRKTDTQFKSELNKVHHGRIIALDKYVNTHTKIKFKCIVCGSVFCTEPNAVLRISGCPKCAYSTGETIIKDLFDDEGIDYESPKKFPDCVYKRQLHFDFYLEKYNLLIEFDGEQHNKAVDFFGGEEYLKDYKIRDSIKNEYAIKNNINLMRIPYIRDKNEVCKIIMNFIKYKSSDYLVNK